MHKNLIVVSVLIAVLVLSYFGYELVSQLLNPCESLFQQTTERLSIKVHAVQTNAQTTVGREKVQDLGQGAQIVALKLKSCCVNYRGRSVAEFDKCQEGVDLYARSLTGAADSLNQAAIQKTPERLKNVQEKLEAVGQRVNKIQQTLPGDSCGMEYLVVSFPKSRMVLVDGVPQGNTNGVLALSCGRHIVTLDGPRDFTPDHMEVKPMNTVPLEPLKLNFALATGG